MIGFQISLAVSHRYSWHTKKYKNTEFRTADLGTLFSSVLKNNAQFFFFYHITVLILKCICRVFHSYENLSTVQIPNTSSSRQINKLCYIRNTSLFAALPS